MVTDPDTLIQQVGRRVAELRVEAGQTQAQMAERVEVSVQYLQRVEAGQENLTLRSLAGLANVLDVEVVALLQAPRKLTTRRGRPPGDRGSSEPVT